MRRRILLAAIGVTLWLLLSLSTAVPAAYYGFERGTLLPSKGLYISIAAQAATLWTLLRLWRGRSVSGPAKAAALFTVLQIVEEVVSGFRPAGQTGLLWWLFTELLGNFAWVVLFVLLAREDKPLEHRETRYAALLAAITTIAGTLAYFYELTGRWRLASAEFWYILPESSGWKLTGVVISAAMHLASAAAVVSFLLAVFHGPPVVEPAAPETA